MFLKASSVGANIVIPFSLKLSFKPAASTAAKKFLNLPSFASVSRMVASKRFIFVS